MDHHHFPPAIGDGDNLSGTEVGDLCDDAAVAHLLVALARCIRSPESVSLKSLASMPMVKG